jgi:hypothetical protein
VHGTGPVPANTVCSDARLRPADRIFARIGGPSFRFPCCRPAGVKQLQVSREGISISAAERTCAWGWGTLIMSGPGTCPQICRNYSYAICKTAMDSGKNLPNRRHHTSSSVSLVDRSPLPRLREIPPRSCRGDLCLAGNQGPVSTASELIVMFAQPGGAPAGPLSHHTPSSRWCTAPFPSLVPLVSSLRPLANLAQLVCLTFSLHIYVAIVTFNRHFNNDMPQVLI